MKKKMRELSCYFWNCFLVSCCWKTKENENQNRDDTLKAKIEQLGRYIDRVGQALGEMDKGSGEEDIVERIEKLLRDMKERGE